MGKGALFTLFFKSPRQTPEKGGISPGAQP